MSYLAPLPRTGKRLTPYKKTAFVIATVALILLVATLAFEGTIRGAVMKSMKVPSVGSVRAIGVGVYGESTCTTKVSSIDWGTIEPGTSKNVVVFIRNEGNAAITLSLSTTSWSPSTASNYISLKWNYGGQSINPNGVIQVTLTLSVSSSITGVSSFSFDIVITSSG